MTEAKQNCIWKWVSGMLTTAMIGMVGTYMATAKDSLSRPEAIELIQNRAPYLQDRAMLVERLRQIQSDVTELKADLRQLRQKKREP